MYINILFVVITLYQHYDVEICIFKQVETIEFAYTIVVSKWVVLGHQYPSIDWYFIWRNKLFKDDYLEKTIDDIDEDNLFDSNKKRREILMRIMYLFSQQEKIKN